MNTTAIRWGRDGRTIGQYAGEESPENPESIHLENGGGLTSKIFLWHRKEIQVWMPVRRPACSQIIFAGELWIVESSYAESMILKHQGKKIAVPGFTHNVFRF